MKNRLYLLAPLVLISKLAMASCGNGGSDVPSNGCAPAINAPTATTVTSSAATAAATANLSVDNRLQQSQLAVGFGVGGAGGQATANGGNSTATGGQASATGGTGYGGIGNGGAATGGSVGAISISTANARNPVSTAVAPSISPTATCAIPLSGGMSVFGFSGSVGSAYIDTSCVLLEQAKAAAALGDVQVAQEMMCAQPAYRAARKRLGRPCMETSYEPISSAEQRDWIDKWMK